MNLDRYQRQIQFDPIGEAGQRKIGASTLFLAGCGATGSVIAAHAVRAGVGRLILCDRDIVELTNLARQNLYVHDDALRGRPKAEAAAERLRRINPEVVIESHAVHIGPQNVERLMEGADCVADGSDNFELRFLLNDAALKLAKPWIYTGVIAATGHTMTVPAGGRPCLRCLIGTPPPPGSIETCATAGVIGPAVGLMGSLAAAETLRILAGHPPRGTGLLTVVDIWNNEHRRVVVEADRRCAACGAGRFDFLDGARGSRATVLCGSDSVQIAPSDGRTQLSLDDLAARLSKAGRVTRGEYHLRFVRAPLAMTIFRDARIIVSGTSDPAKARAFVDKHI